MKPRKYKKKFKLKNKVQRAIKWLCVKNKSRKAAADLATHYNTDLKSAYHYLASQDPFLGLDRARRSVKGYTHNIQLFYSSYLLFTCDSIHAIAHICHGNSICPSVCLSHRWISQKRLKLGSRNFHYTVAPSL